MPLGNVNSHQGSTSVTERRVFSRKLSSELAAYAHYAHSATTRPSGTSMKVTLLSSYLNGFANSPRQERRLPKRSREYDPPRYSPHIRLSPQVTTPFRLTWSR